MRKRDPGQESYAEGQEAKKTNQNKNQGKRFLQPQQGCASRRAIGLCHVPRAGRLPSRSGQAPKPGLRGELSREQLPAGKGFSSPQIYVELH